MEYFLSRPDAWLQTESNQIWIEPMPDVPQPTCRVLLLDLRIGKRAPPPALPGLVVVNPNPATGDLSLIHI